LGGFTGFGAGVGVTITLITSSKLPFIASLVSYLSALFFFAFAINIKLQRFCTFEKGNPYNTLGGVKDNEYFD
jgi:hypothetical protein